MARITDAVCVIALPPPGSGAAVVPEPVTALAVDGVTYRPLVRRVATVELALAHRSARTEPHLLRILDISRRLF